jgi:cell division septum initiation protein DivIVA
MLKYTLDITPNRKYDEETNSLLDDIIMNIRELSEEYEQLKKDYDELHKMMRDNKMIIDSRIVQTMRNIERKAAVMQDIGKRKIRVLKP